MHRRGMSSTAVTAVRSALVLFACLAVATALSAQTHEETDHDEHERHFTHPLFAESVSPDTKLRLDYSHLNVPGGHGANEMELEGEYAFTHFFSIEAGVSLDPDAGQLGETHALFKFVNDALEPAGIHLGYGVELGFPTGTSHEHGDVQLTQSGATAQGSTGDNIYEITPFLNAGWMSGPWEVIGWSLFQIPTNQDSQDEVGSELLFNASVLKCTPATVSTHSSRPLAARGCPARKPARWPSVSRRDCASGLSRIGRSFSEPASVSRSPTTATSTATCWCRLSGTSEGLRLQATTWDAQQSKTSL
jgi:hypothetical protein